MRKIITVAILIASLHSTGQHVNKGNHIQFQSINQLGMVVGETGNAFQIQTVDGIRIKKFFTGIGVGIDEYQVRSIPLFLDFRMNVKESGKTPFVYADGGTHFIWPKEKNEMVTYDDAGFYYDLGVGYSIPVKSNAVLLSAGYSFKSYSSRENSYYYYWWNYYPEDYIENSYKLRRISIKAAFSF
jgi:hypothetical protein